MKVSIIMPIYNAEKYLAKSLDSIISQNYKNLEIILINDGSTDMSLSKLIKYSEKYEFVKIINQKNRGVSAARNIGINESKGEYIYFLDSDDYLELDAMEYCYNAAKKYNLDIVSFDAKSFVDNEYEGSKLIENYDRSKILDSIVMKGSEFFEYLVENRAYENPIWLNFYRREFLVKNNLYFHENIIHEDEIHTLKTVISANRAMYIPKQFFNRRVRGNSIMTTKLGYKNAYSMKIVSKEGYDFYIENKGKFSNNIDNILIDKIRYFYWIAIRYCDKMEENELIKNKLRCEILNQLNDTQGIITNKLKYQIYNPHKYYKLEDFKIKIKGIVKTSKYSSFFRKVLICLKRN